MRLTIWSCLLILGILSNSSMLFGQTDDDVRKLIDKLDSDDFNTRTDAQETLEKFISDNKLTAAQLGILRTYPQNPPLEVLKRRENILATWTEKFPSVQKVLDGVRVSDINESAVDISFKIDGFEGSIAAPEDSDIKEVKQLMLLYEATRNALVAADTGKVEDALTKLKTFVADPNKLKGVIYLKGLDEAKTEDVVNELQQSLTNTQKAIQDIKIGSNNVQPPPRQPVPMKKGALDSGRTLAVLLGTDPLVAGGLDIFMPPLDLTLYPLLPGYRYASDIFDILATDGGEISGGVSIGIQYGSEFDALSLRLLRQANGSGEILPLSSCSNDSVHSIFTCTYFPDFSLSGPDQFGEFALVTATPESATVLLSAIGLLGVVLLRLRRRSDGTNQKS